MKKRFLTTLCAGALAAAVAVPAIAATVDDVTPHGSTEVTANIVDPGYVSYTITIPDKVDFGTLTQPENTDTNHYVFANFQVEATDLTIKSNQGVTVYMKDSNYTDDQFYITQKNAETPFKISYDVYNTEVDADSVDNNNAIHITSASGQYGYHICTFLYGTKGQTQPIYLALNQNALYGQTISNIAGDYSGTITFHSALVEIS